MGDNDGTIWLWDVKTRQAVRSHTVSGKIDGFTKIAISNDGHIALLASSNDTIRVWDLEKWREVRRLIGHTYAVTDVAISPDKHFALSASLDSVRLWNLDNGESIRQLSQTYQIRSLAFSPDGQTALFASEDGQIFLWDIPEWRLLHCFESHHGAAYSVAFSANGDLAIWSDRDNMVCVWDLKKKEKIKNLSGHKDLVIGTLFSPDHQYAVSADITGTVLVWDLKKDCVIRQFSTEVTKLNDYAGIQGLSLSPVGNQVLFFDGSGGSCNEDCADSTLYLWDIETGKAQRFLLNAAHTE